LRYKIFKLGETFKTVFYKTESSGRDYDFIQDGFTEIQNDDKLDNNIARSRSRVKELALCNPFTHFFTLTLDCKKHDRYDLDGYVKKLGKWIYHYNRKYNTKLKYLIIPEQCKDGAWHMHGLMYGLHPDSLITNKHGYLDMPFYAERFGWISIAPINSDVGVSYYITKYIKKSMHATEIKVNKHMFYASNGLKGKELVHEDFTGCIPDDVYENDYVGVKGFNNYDDLSAFITKMQKEDEKYDDYYSDTGVSSDTSDTGSQPCNNPLLQRKSEPIQRLSSKPRYIRCNALTRSAIRLKTSRTKHHVYKCSNLYKSRQIVSDVVLQ
jgi:hypothetical protein